jgi:hypothetical protein
MLDAFTTTVEVKGLPKSYWISGTTILQLANWVMEDVPPPRAATVGEGTLAKPWQMTGDLRQWVSMARALGGHTQVERHFWICGRFIKKFSKDQAFYMADGGGGLKMTSCGTPPPGTVWARTGNNPNKPDSGEAFSRGGPSYRNIGNRLDALRGSADDLTWSRDVANKLRQVLQGDDGAATSIRKHGHMSLGQTLPTIAAAMFLGEAGRNPRAFLVNKMLLDMIETGTTYGGRKPGAAPKAYTMKSAFFRESKTGGDPGDKGGKMPAAMTGSGEAYRKPIGPDPTAVANYKYTQAKEVTVICHACHGGTFTGTDESRIDKRAFVQLTTPAKVAEFKSLDFTQDAQVLGYLRYLMGCYLHSFAL